MAQVFHVNFDTAPDGALIANGTVVNTLYADWGVTFDAIRCEVCGSDTNVYANANCLIGGPISAPNVVTLYGMNTCSDICEAYHGLVQATFATPADFVCIRVKPVRPTYSGVLHAYNSSGQEIATGFSAPGVTQDVCLMTPGIKRVTFSGSGTSYTWSDDLVFRIPGPPDADKDGVPDADDQCPDTSAGAIVDAQGCSIDQLVPCAGPRTGGTWKNHGQYVSSVARTAEAFLAAGLITAAENDAIVAAAAHSDCGRRPPPFK